MVSNSIRVGIVGCGRVAQHYRYIIAEYPINGLDVVSCCDIDINKAEELSSDFGATVYTDYMTMLKMSEIDLVVILTESGKHYEHAKMALDAGCHVIVEKPITMLPEQAYELEKVASKLDLMICPVYQNRFNPAMAKLRRTMDAGRFGKIITTGVRVRWCRYQDYYEDGWHGTWKMDGGVINQQAIHHIDAINWLCGPVKRVCAMATNRINNLEAEDTITALLEFSDGSLGTIEATTAARPKDFEASLSIVGENGMATVGGIALNNIELWEFVNKESDDNIVPQKYSIDVPNGYGLGHVSLLNEVVKSLRMGSFVPPISVTEGAGSVELVHGMYASIESGGWVNLVDDPHSMRLGIG